MASYDKPEVVERDVKDKEHEEDDKPIVVERDVKDKEHKEDDKPEVAERDVKDKEHKEDDKPEVAERDVKDKEHKEDDKEEGKGGFLEKVKDFIHDIGEKIEGAIGFGKPTADVTGLHVNSINLEKAEFVIEILIKNPNPVPIPLIDINYLIESDGRKLISGLIPDAGTIKAHGEETVKIPVTLIYDDIKNTYSEIKPEASFHIESRPKDFGSALWDMIRGKGTGYSMKGNINVDTPFGSMKLPITKEGGTTRIKKNKEDGGDDERRREIRVYTYLVAPRERNRGDIGRSGHISSCGLFISSGLLE
ncbi:late embryogenesis abundant protein lea14-a [Quercus suber]|uniref:Late embryogenesis abundant protein lea14-a n=1 Tax=Quercus suber TaxID=58331 RepID=A0AAW0JEQ8_QUESU